MDIPGTIVYNRNGEIPVNPTYEKNVILPSLTETDLSTITWCDARFAIDIMEEHALFFTLLMPPEICPDERLEAQGFHTTFSNISKMINDNGIPANADVRTYVNSLTDAIKPFIDYKYRMMYAQESGKLKSLVWPLFWHHTISEAERWSMRLGQLAKGEIEYDKLEVMSFNTDIMAEHAQFEAHLLDPCETKLIKIANEHAKTFYCHRDSIQVDVPMTQKETNRILADAEHVLDFETKTVRGIEAGRIKSIIDPRLEDHLRRETLKFIDEIQRAV